MLEIEAKYLVADWADVERRLLEWGATAGPPRRNRDEYFRAPDRDFAATGEAFRLRRVDDDNFLTYKGPRRSTQSKTRLEHEVSLGGGDGQADGVRRLLELLGYESAGEVVKTRREYRLTRDGYSVTACLDDAGPLGRFVELEIVAAEDDFAAAESALLSMAGELGLTDQEPRSYFSMWLASQGLT